MTSDILIVVRHGPYGSFQAPEGLRHANGAVSMGFRPVFVLIDDGVYLARAGQDPGDSQWLSLSETLEELVARGLYENKENPAEFYAEKESLAKRGLDENDLVEDLEIIDNARVSELFAANSLQLIF
ncbi:MAG: DsrE family protein [Desulfobacterales bacterium]